MADNRPRISGEHRMGKVLSQLSQGSDARFVRANSDVRFCNLMYEIYAQWEVAGFEGASEAPEIASLDAIHRKALAVIEEWNCAGRDEPRPAYDELGTSVDFHNDLDYRPPDGEGYRDE